MRTIVIVTVLFFIINGLSAQDLFLQNAQVVDPAQREVRRQNLLIQDGKIVGAADEAPPDFSGKTLNLEGKWVIPALNDLHTHSYGNMGPGNFFETPGTAVVARRMLYAGVASLLDLFGREDSLYELRAQQRKGEIPGADIYASLSCLTAPNGHCTEYGIPTRVMDSPEQATEVISDLARKQPDVIKIVYAPTGRMPSINKETLEAAVAAAKQLGIKTVIHVRSWQDVRDSVAAGATAVTHVPSGEPIPNDLPALMARRGVYSIPTLSVQTDFGNFVEDPAVLEHPLARALATETLIKAYRSDQTRQHRTDQAEDADAHAARVLASVKAMADAGVKILSGTDSGNWGTLQGYSVHRELVHLVDAGLSPWQALAASTTDASRFLGQPFGVSTGDLANLVVLDASPLEDISHTTRIHLVIHHGKVIDREALLK